MSGSFRAPGRPELAETSHKIKSAKMRSGAEMKIALEALDRQISITQASSNMQQARMRQHLEDLHVLSRRLAAEPSEATSAARVRTAAAMLPTRRLKDRSVVAPSLSEEHAFRELLLRRLQLLNCMRLPSNYAKRLLADDEQSDFDHGAYAWAPAITTGVSADQRARPRTSLHQGSGERRTRTACARATDQKCSREEELTSKEKTERMVGGGEEASKEKRLTDDGEYRANDSSVSNLPMPRPPDCSKGGDGRGSSRRSTSSSRRSARSSAGQSIRLFLGRSVPDSCSAAGITAADTQQKELLERQKRFYESLKVLRRLSISDFLVGLRHSVPAETTSHTFAEANTDEDKISEETLKREFKDVLGYCKKTATSLTWKSLVKVI